MQGSRSKRGVSSQRRVGPVPAKLATAVALVLFVMTAVCATASAQERTSLPGSLSFLSADGDPPPALLGRGLAGDWDHVVQVTSWLRYKPPRRRVVYLLGGSATRESVISESAWAAQLRRLTGKSATTYVCATSCQTFAEDALIVSRLPKGRGSVLISVGTSRFNMLHASASLPRRIRRTPPRPWYQHHYDTKTSLPYAQKRARVSAWIEDSYPLFQARYEDRLADLARVIDACKARGLRVALLEMPLNLPVIGDDFHDALATYRQACLSLANERGIKYIRFVSGVGLKSTDFYDLQHLLPSGRAKWQSRLSRELLRKHLI